MRRPDGIETSLPPNPAGLGVGIVGVLGSLALMTWSICLGLTLFPVFALVTFNYARGRERVRVLPNKLLVEYSRPVRELLIGPAKERVSWDDFASATVSGDHVEVTSKGGPKLQIGRGCPQDELSELVERIERVSKEEPLL